MIARMKDLARRATGWLTPQLDQPQRGVLHLLVAHAAAERRELIEVTPTSDLFTTPTDKRTEAYITGRFG